ncbi:MAG: LemA family protein, partial [Chloroflexi bacterium]|nr:LemA family protein [Chloroflexota bacterium]
MKVRWFFAGIVVLVLVLALVAGIYVRSTHRDLDNGWEAVDDAWYQIETVYEPRLDMMNALMTATADVQRQSPDIYAALDAAGEAYVAAVAPDDRAQQATVLEAGLARVVAAVKANPQASVRADVVKALNSLAQSEQAVAPKRTQYNAAVAHYNSLLHGMPSSM